MGTHHLLSLTKNVYRLGEKRYTPLRIFPEDSTNTKAAKTSFHEPATSTAAVSWMQKKKKREKFQCPQFELKLVKRGGDQKRARHRCEVAEGCATAHRTVCACVVRFLSPTAPPSHPPGPGADPGWEGPQSRPPCCLPTIFPNDFSRAVWRGECSALH